MNACGSKKLAFLGKKPLLRSTVRNDDLGAPRKTIANSGPTGYPQAHYRDFDAGIYQGCIFH
jgi:hypothetical protein